MYLNLYKQLFVWFALIIVPVVPVYVIYQYIDAQNYFELKDFQKVVVATGPIAAYIFLVWLGMRIWNKILLSVSPTDSRIERLMGEWDYRSVSGHSERVFTGTCRFQDANGRATMSGTVLFEDKEVGSWASLTTTIGPNGQLLLVYEISEITDSGVEKMEGIAKISIPATAEDPMSGIWVVIGQSSKAGTIAFNRKSS